MGSIPLGDYGVLRGFCESPGLAAGASATLVLDGERGELVRTPSRVGKKGNGGVLDARVAMALKSHSEAERRRRQRINGHLTTLRSMIPCTEKVGGSPLGLLSLLLLFCLSFVATLLPLCYWFTSFH